jgi:hypothetical protein
MRRGQEADAQLDKGLVRCESIVHQEVDDYRWQQKL